MTVLRQFLLPAFCACFFFVVLPPQSVQGQDYKVGDEIRFEHMRKEVTGIITQVLPRQTGYWVEYDGGGRFPRKTVVRPNKILGAGKSGGSKTNGDSPGGAAVSGLRKWRAKEGGHEIEAKFVDLVDGKVDLEKTDGRVISVGLEILVDDDADLARKLKAGMSGEATASEPESPPDSNFKVVEMSFKSAKGVTVGTTDTWSATPETPFQMDKAARTKLYPIPCEVNKVIIDKRTPSRVYLGKRDQRTRMETGCVVDLVSGKTFGPFTFDKPHSEVIAFDSKTNRIATKTGIRERGLRTVDIWGIKGAGVEHKFGFGTNPDPNKVGKSVSDGYFLDGQRIVLTVADQAGVFNLETMEAELGIAFKLGQPIRFSPRGKYLLGGVGKQVVEQTVFYDVAAKKTVGVIDQVLGLTADFGVNESMTKMAVVERNRLVIRNLKSGEVVDQVYLPRMILAGKEPIFIDKDNILLASRFGTVLVNIPLKSPIWKYTADFKTIPGVSSLLTVGKVSRDNYVAGFVEIPHKAAQSQISSMNLEDLIVVPRGSEVSFNARMNAESKTMLTKQLESHGYKVVANSPYQIRTTVTKGPTTTRTYKSMTGGADETVQIKSESYEIAMYHNDEKIWFRTGGSSNDQGNFVHLNEGESLQGRMNKAKGSADGFFQSTGMPDLFLKWPPTFYYGSTGLGDL